MRCYDRQTTQLLFLDARVCSLHIFTYMPKYLVLNSEDPFPSENGFYKVILDPISHVYVLKRVEVVRRHGDSGRIMRRVPPHSRTDGRPLTCWLPA